jgi:hypothetical protein
MASFFGHLSAALKLESAASIDFSLRTLINDRTAPPIEPIAGAVNGHYQL